MDLTDVCMTEPKPNHKRFAAGVWKMHLLILTIGLVLIGIVGYGFYSGDRINTVDAALVRSAMKIKLEVSTTNLVIEGLLGEGLATDFEPVWAPLDAALRDFRSVVDASRQRRAVLPFGAAAVDAAVLANLERKLSAFKEKAAERFANRRISLLDDEADRVYRRAFKDLARDLDALENRLRRVMSANLTLFRYSQAAMIVLCVLLTGLAAALFQRFAGRLARAYASLQAANERLENEIVERRRSENAARAGEKRFRQLARELKDFSNAVSHDLRAPLINLKGFSREIEAALEVLRPVIDGALAAPGTNSQKEVTAAFYEDLPEALDFIGAAVSKMERLTNAVLKLSRLGRRELMLERLDMNAIVRDTLKSLGHQIKAGGIRLAVGDLPATTADRVSMEQVFSNIVGNAVNYLDPGRTGEIEIGGEGRLDEDIFFVRDNGRGIKDCNVEKVFNLFERLGTDCVAGEGMGLAYVRALVRRHEGEIYCESEFGAGTRFTFTISKRLNADEDIAAD
jgi:signal transduction histidine kinase